jgi:hypothetical protein
VLLEVNSVQARGLACWLVGNSVISDGSLLLLTAMDPTFLAIPLLEKTASDRWVDVRTVFATLHAAEKDRGDDDEEGDGNEDEDDDDDDEMYGIASAAKEAANLQKEAWGNLRRLRTCRGLDLSAVCDEEESMGARLVRYNDRKTVRWLAARAVRLSRSLGALEASRVAGEENYLRSRGLSTARTFAAASSERGPKRRRKAVRATGKEDEDEDGGDEDADDEEPVEERAVVEGGAQAAAAALLTKAAEAYERANTGAELPSRGLVVRALLSLKDLISDALLSRTVDFLGISDDEMNPARAAGKKHAAGAASAAAATAAAAAAAASASAAGSRDDLNRFLGRKSADDGLSEFDEPRAGEKRAREASLAQKKLLKVDKSGMKSLTSFFGAKKPSPPTPAAASTSPLTATPSPAAPAAAAAPATTAPSPPT